MCAVTSTASGPVPSRPIGKLPAPSGPSVLCNQFGPLDVDATLGRGLALLGPLAESASGAGISEAHQFPPLFPPATGRPQSTMMSSPPNTPSVHPPASSSFLLKPLVKTGGKSKKSKSSSKPYSPLKTSENSVLELSSRKGKSTLAPEGGFPPIALVPSSDSCSIGKISTTNSSSVPIICRAGSASADTVARGPVLSGLDAEQSAQVARDLPGLVSSISTSPLDAESLATCKLFAESEAQVLARFQSTLTDAQPPLSSACMDYIRFDDESALSETSAKSEDGLSDDAILSDADMGEDAPSDLLIHALLDEGFSRGDIERRFGLEAANNSDRTNNGSLEGSTAVRGSAQFSAHPSQSNAVDSEPVLEVGFHHLASSEATNPRNNLAENNFMHNWAL